MNTIIMILNLLPALITAIRAIEDAIPGQGQGEAKLAMLRGVLESADSVTKTIWPNLEKAIAVIVPLITKK
jgi:hypothetical protein